MALLKTDVYLKTDRLYGLSIGCTAFERGTQAAFDIGRGTQLILFYLFFYMLLYMLLKVMLENHRKFFE
jgi:hypothetical protein